MKIKTNEASDVVLDGLVVKCEGIQDSEFVRTHIDAWPYSTAWSQGGPIIEREKINIWWDGVWHAKYDGCRPDQVQDAHTPLIAAMRCYVASKLGDEVEIPNELIGE